jgi:hypothetical protein
LSRIFVSLAWFALITMAAALILGFAGGDLHHDRAPETLRWGVVHRLTGIAAALVVVLVNSIVIVYFIGTSRWCKEVCEAYRLDRSLVARSSQLKRRTFPWAVTGMLTVVGVIALGGAADPGTLRPGTEWWVTPHMLGAMAGLIIVAWVFWVLWQNIARNQMVIADVMTEVRRIREEHGLEV